MKWRHFLLIGLCITPSLFGCQPREGTPPATEAPRVQFEDDPHLAPYKRKYYRWAERLTGESLARESIPIRFQYLGYTEDHGGVTGMCRVWTSPDGEMISRYIEIDPVFWSLSNEAQKQNLIYHEFGHCSLRRPHHGSVRGGWPVSIMYPDLLPSGLFLENQRRYLSELFLNSYLQNTRAPQMFAVRQTNLPAAGSAEQPIGAENQVLIKNIFHHDASGRSTCTVVVENSNASSLKRH